MRKFFIILLAVVFLTGTAEAKGNHSHGMKSRHLKLNTAKGYKTLYN
jgi:hypothetical protein